MANWMKQADDKLRGGFMGKLFGGPKYGEAQVLYLKAAGELQFYNQWDMVAEAFLKGADCARKSGDFLDQADCLEKAGDALEHVNVDLACEQYRQAFVILGKASEHSKAGHLMAWVADLRARHGGDSREVRELYQRAADMFALDKHEQSHLFTCNCKVAELSARLGELKEAIRLLEKEAVRAVVDDQLASGAKDRFLDAGILHLALGDSVSAKSDVQRWRTLDQDFATSRQGKLLGDLIAAFERKEVAMFAEKLHQFDEMMPLNPWRVDFLLKATEHIPALT